VKKEVSNNLPFEKTTKPSNRPEISEASNTFERASKLNEFEEETSEPYMSKIDLENSLDVPAFLRKRSYHNK